ncbi:hypothetical protein NUW58_g2249 [Xylaria curta]|uniref:Uncharacterized protein n=1 Tax=Xylaria curta TaxID=42375 RepID=A0ACC1PH13_9PEZI|nr:hypothetical protein NUW58_g2249 [Xylaria curta]
MVYLEGTCAEGFVVLTFWWEELERQVRVEGRATRISSEESQKYYDTRARGSRIGAWASRQSQVLTPGASEGSEEDDGRRELEGWVAETEERFQGQEQIPVPEFWGGLRLVPESIEFWQGRQSRLHDRFLYTKKTSAPDGNDEWTRVRRKPNVELGEHMVIIYSSDVHKFTFTGFSKLNNDEGPPIMLNTNNVALANVARSHN